MFNIKNYLTKVYHSCTIRSNVAEIIGLFMSARSNKSYNTFYFHNNFIRFCYRELPHNINAQNYIQVWQNRACSIKCYTCYDARKRVLVTGLVGGTLMASTRRLMLVTERSKRKACGKHVVHILYKK